MYSTCIHCSQSLGANESIEPFPVGRRLAFDAATGRLWVVCAHCDRWNLSPLEERWEAIEACERRFRGTRVRVSTDQIGLCRLADGLELVRIGQPLRPEFAAWRYGRHFGMRRVRNLVRTSVTTSVGAAAIGGVMYAAWMIPFASIFLQLFPEKAIRLLRKTWGGGPDAVVARTIGPTGEPLEITRGTADYVQLLQPTDNSPIRLSWNGGALEGDESVRAARLILPHLNRFGGSTRTVARAVHAIDQHGGPHGLLMATSRAIGQVQRAVVPGRYSGDTSGQTTLVSLPGARSTGFVRDLPFGVPGSIRSLNAVHRLAFELALHEEQELRAMEGELALLEQAWREAEEVAQIADALFVPASVTDRLAALRKESRGQTIGHQ
jgi:hypothetical protein